MATHEPSPDRGAPAQNVALTAAKAAAGAIAVAAIAFGLWRVRDLLVLVTLVTVSVVGLLFGTLAVVLAIPAASAAETLIDVLVFGHDPPPTPPPRRLLPPRTSSSS